MQDEYRPTLREIISEMGSDVARSIRRFGGQVATSVKTKKGSLEATTRVIQDIPRYSRSTLGIISDILSDMETSLLESYHTTKEFAKGFVHDGLEVLIFPYMVPSAHRLPRLEWAQEWREYSEYTHSWLCSGQHYQGGSFGGCRSKPRPDAKQYGGIFGTLTGLGLTVAEGIGYYYMARKGYPNLLVLALPVVTNTASGLYEYGVSVSQRLIQKHSQRS